MEQQHQSTESTLLRNLAIAKDGSKEARTAVYETLKVEAGNIDLLPTVRTMLFMKDEGLRQTAAIFIGQFGEAAQPLATDLASLAKADVISVRHPAIFSLGQIPCDVSAKTLTEIFEGLGDGKDDREVLSLVLDALKGQGSAIAPYMSRLELTAASYAGDMSVLVNRSLNELREQLRREATIDLREAKFQSAVPLRVPTGTSASEHFAPYRSELPSRAGIVFEGRLLFSTGTGDHDVDAEHSGGGVRSNVGIQIYRSARPDINSVVVFTADGEWYGASPDNAIEQLSTAAVHMYGLDPSQTQFIIRWAVSSGMTKRGSDECDLVTMNFDARKEAFESPSWKALPSLEDLLDDYGMRP